MNLIDMLSAHGSAAMTLLAGLEGVSREDLLARGVEEETADAMLAHFDTYFGPTKSRAKQRTARECAEHGGLGFARLDAIDRFVRRLTDKSKEWAFRVALTRFTGGRRDFLRFAKAQLEAFNEPVSPASKRSLKVTHHKGTTDATLTVRGPSVDIREIENIARSLADDHSTEPAAALIDAFLNGDAGTRGTKYTVKVLVSAPDWARILSGEGDDVLVATNTGAVMSGSQLLQKEIAKYGEFVLMSNVAGPVSISTGKLPGWALTRRELARAQETRGGPPIPEATVHKALARHGTRKDRLLAEAVQTVCAGEDCSVPAHRCELNHNIPYFMGGLSLIGNFSLLCSHHNGAAGATETYRNIRGEPHRLLYDGREIRNNHPLARFGGMRVVYGESSKSENYFSM